jgi:hypothetical protein
LRGRGLVDVPGRAGEERRRRNGKMQLLHVPSWCMSFPLSSPLLFSGLFLPFLFMFLSIYLLFSLACKIYSPSLLSLLSWPTFPN